VRAVGRTRGSRRIGRPRAPGRAVRPSDPSLETYYLYRKGIRNTSNVDTLDLLLKQAKDRKDFLGGDRWNKLQILADKQRVALATREPTTLQKLKNAVPSFERAEVEARGGIDRALPTGIIGGKVAWTSKKKKSTTSAQPPTEQGQTTSQSSS